LISKKVNKKPKLLLTKFLKMSSRKGHAKA